MCAELGYFYVFPCFAKAYNSPENKSMKPIILTYKDDDTEMKELMADYKSKLPQFQDKKYLSFSLSNGCLID